MDKATHFVYFLNLSLVDFSHLQYLYLGPFLLFVISFSLPISFMVFVSFLFRRSMLSLLLVSFLWLRSGFVFLLLFLPMRISWIWPRVSFFSFLLLFVRGFFSLLFQRSRSWVRFPPRPGFFLCKILLFFLLKKFSLLWSFLLNLSFLQIKVKVNLVLVGNGQSREIGVFGHLFGFNLFYYLHLGLGSGGLFSLLW